MTVTGQKNALDDLNARDSDKKCAIAPDTSTKVHSLVAVVLALSTLSRPTSHQAQQRARYTYSSTGQTLSVVISS
jgi:ABC-type sulfate transport system substrate-binding protein